MTPINTDHLSCNGDGNFSRCFCFDLHKHGSYIGNIPVCSPDAAAALLPDLVILGVLDEERRNSMIKQMENLGYHGPFRDPSVLRMFDARVAVMRLLSEHRDLRPEIQNKKFHL